MESHQPGALDTAESSLSCGSFLSKIRSANFLKTSETACAPALTFAREILRSPRQAGAICPSGASLSKAMAREAITSDGLVLELGAGTGAVTRALIDRGIAPENIAAVEQSAQLAAFLRNRFPRVNVIEGDASRLSELLAGRPIDSIVSSLPLVSLPEAVRVSIIEQIKRLAAGKRFVQFTYFWGDAYLKDFGFKPLRSQMIFKNFPPARVMTFEI